MFYKVVKSSFRISIQASINFFCLLGILPDNMLPFKSKAARYSEYEVNDVYPYHEKTY